MEFLKSPPSLKDIQQLEQSGFSQEQITCLESVKARYQASIYHDTACEYNRLAFIRWLYLQGRLQS